MSCFIVHVCICTSYFQTCCLSLTLFMRTARRMSRTPSYTSRDASMNSFSSTSHGGCRVRLSTAPSTFSAKLGTTERGTLTLLIFYDFDSIFFYANHPNIFWCIRFHWLKINHGQSFYYKKWSHKSLIIQNNVMPVTDYQKPLCVTQPSHPSRQICLKLLQCTQYCTCIIFLYSRRYKIQLVKICTRD